jgi:hypothetical protein
MPLPMPARVVVCKSIERTEQAMKFISLSGKTLMRIVEADEISPEALAAAGVNDESVVRINQQGDIEIRRASGWDVIGGLLGDFKSRLRDATGMDWVTDATE